MADGTLKYAFSLPKQSGYKPVLTGSVCLLLSFLVLPILTLAGYVYRLTATAATGSRRQPPFTDLLHVTGKGFIFSLLGVLIASVGITVIYVAEGAYATVLTDDNAAVASVLLGVCVFYFSPAVLTLYPATGRLGVALSPQRILDFAATKTYFVSFIIFSAVLLSVLVSGYLLLLFTISMFIVSVYSMVFALFVPALLVVFFITLVLGFGGGLLAIGASVYLLYAAGSYWGATYHEAVQDGVVQPPMNADTRTRPELSPESQEPVRNRYAAD